MTSSVAHRHERIMRVIRPLLNSDSVDDICIQSYERDYPFLFPELGEYLKRLQIVRAARKTANGTNGSTTETLLLDSERFLPSVCVNCGSQTSRDHDDSGCTLWCQQCGESLVIESNGSTVPTIGRPEFRFIGCLGVGTFGEVWLAFDSKLKRDVAIKVPRQRKLSAEKTRRFLTEGEAAAGLSHPNIAKVFEAHHCQGTPYIVTELVVGKTLERLLRQRDFAPREIAAICAKIARGLEHAHQRGIVHRDIKPANIILNSANEPVITDFGLAKQSKASVRASLDGKMVGTLAYMAPEQAAGASNQADARSDIYSLGSVLFELCTKQVPFTGDGKQNVAQRVMHEPPRNPRTLNSRVPRDLATICLKCLEKSPDKRFASAHDLAEQLDLFLDAKPLTIKPVRFVERVYRHVKRRPHDAVVLGSLGAALLLLMCLLSSWNGNSELAQTLRNIFSRSAQQRAAFVETRRQEARYSRRALNQKLLSASRIVQSDSRRAMQMLDEIRSSKEFTWYFLYSRCKDVVNDQAPPQSEFPKTRPPANAMLRIPRNLVSTDQGSIVDPSTDVSNNVIRFAGPSVRGKLSRDANTRVFQFDSDNEFLFCDENGQFLGSIRAEGVATISAQSQDIVWVGFADGRIQKQSLKSGNVVDSTRIDGSAIHINAEAFSNHVILASEQNIFMQDKDDGRLISVFRATQSNPRFVSIVSSLRTKQIVAFGVDRRIRVWDLDDIKSGILKPIQIMAVSDGSDQDQLVLSTLGSRLALRNASRIVFWKRQSGRFVETAIASIRANGLTFSDDSQEHTVATWNRDGIQLRDPELGDLRAEIAAEEIVDVSFDADREMWSLDASGQIRRWFGRPLRVRPPTTD